MRKGTASLIVPRSPWDALAQLRRHRLAKLPTPLLPMRRLAQAIGGVDIWFKRDDLISFGLGGNKVRGLELLVADALAEGAEVLVTGAGVQSNHVRATAAAAACCGLRCIAVFWGDAPQRADGNYRVTRLLGAEAVFTGDPERASVDRGIEALCEELRHQGQRFYPSRAAAPVLSVRSDMRWRRGSCSTNAASSV